MTLTQQVRESFEHTPQDPGGCLDRAMKQIALLSSVNEQIALYEQQYNTKIVEHMDAGSSVSGSESKAKSGEEYLRFKALKGMGKALEESIITLRHRAEQLGKELQLTK